MKNVGTLVRELKHVFKKKNSSFNQSSILKNIKIQNMYTNDKINKKEHYIYFREHDIKTNDINYAHLMKTKQLFKNGRGAKKNFLLFTTITSTIGIVLFVFSLSSKGNNYTY
ncbi:conserved Plasmodium protein, unknown function [Plasmodium ovale]|uniref:Uncharacterized protein n=1 Tax=Plasmodium ovale TaxID=36330 RepID=A0A1D3TL53_PLAOA|nr:conserved Plasmodium protein, unknown function [Plasmodium ovale]